MKKPFVAGETPFVEGDSDVLPYNEFSAGSGVEDVLPLFPFIAPICGRKLG